MKPTLPFAQYDKETNHLHILHKNIPDGVTNLYSHPAELTDEEIEIECRKAWGLHDQDQLNLEEVLKFAKAILRKAQEK